jgi:DNA-binding PadR family transcriptional regulator
MNPDPPDETEKRLPLTPAVFHILLALADRERHGYGIMLEVERNTGGELKMGPGTLYGTVKRLLAAALIEESDTRPDPELDDERRRYYRLTDRGRQVLGAETVRLERLVQVARARQSPQADLLSPAAGAAS